MNPKCLTVLALGFVALFYGPSAAVAQPLSSFAVLGGSTVTNTNTPTIVSGNLGVSPGSAVTGFPPGIVTGTIHAADAVAAQAQSDLTTTYNNLASSACNTDLTGQDLGGKTLTPGVYCFSTSAQLTGTLTLDGQGNSSAVFVFKIGSTLTTASASSVVLINSASSCGVFWQVGSSATLGTGTALAGSIVALTSITLNTGASLSGRALARNGAVTLDDNNVTVCSGGPGGGSGGALFPGAAAIPTLSEWAMIVLSGLLFCFGLAVLRRRAT
jgi:Ice-binding-like/IPTL-CTERM motif